MNSLTDLRRTLDQHADLADEQVADPAAVARTTAVHHRIAGVRRRRRAVGSGALALVVATVIGVLGVQRASSTPPPVVFGVSAPETVNSLGYTYRTDGRAETIDGTGSMQLDASTRPRLVTWTTDRPTTVRLTLPGGEHWTSSVSRFRDFVVIPPGPSGKLRVSVGDGRVGVATYDLTDALPAGVTRDGITFRSTVAETRLLAAAIGATGQTSVRTSFDWVPGQVRISVLCVGSPRGSLLHVAMGGAETTSGCDGGTSFDPGSDVIGSAEAGHPGRTVRVRAWVSGPHTSTPLSQTAAEGVRVGVGLYGPVPTDHVAGLAMPGAIEYGGHSWHFDRGLPMRSSPLRFAGGSSPSLAVVAMRLGKATTQMRIKATGMPADQSGFSGRGAGTSGPYWVPAGAQVRVSRSTPGALAVGVYARDD